LGSRQRCVSATPAEYTSADASKLRLSRSALYTSQDLASAQTCVGCSTEILDVLELPSTGMLAGSR
jgi:hypothetical protein